MNKVNCFAYCGAGTCSATNHLKCVCLKGKNCVFYKTPEEFKAGCEKSAARIVSFNYNKCRPIFERYCLYNEGVVPEFKEAMKNGMKNML